MTTVPEYPNIIRQKTNIQPVNVFEIGASNGMDSEFLRGSFNILPQNVYCFEAHPGNYKTLTESYPDFKCFDVAVSDTNGKLTFQLHGPSADISSFRKRDVKTGLYPYPGHVGINYHAIDVEVCRMDSFIDAHGITKIDICKIDVEGCSYEVLEGFGSKLQLVKTMHVEAETAVMWEGERLFNEIEQLLIRNNFVMVDYQSLQDGLMCDTIWVRKDMVK